MLPCSGEGRSELLRSSNCRPGNPENKCVLRGLIKHGYLFLCPFHFKCLICHVLMVSESSNWKQPHTLQGINISHLGKRKIIFKMPFWGDMLVPWRVSHSFQCFRFQGVETNLHLNPSIPSLKSSLMHLASGSTSSKSFSASSHCPEEASLSHLPEFFHLQKCVLEKETRLKNIIYLKVPSWLHWCVECKSKSQHAIVTPTGTCKCLLFRVLWEHIAPAVEKTCRWRASKE